MSSSFDLPSVTTFATGTEGPPGQRVFFLQATTDSQVVTLRLEKQQVAVLAEYLGRIVTSMESDSEFDDVAEMPALYQPVIAEWVIGSIMVAIDESESRLIVIAEELTQESNDPDEALDVAQARFSLTPTQVRAFVKGAEELVMAGRPPCPLCSRPMGPDGHFCPRLN